MEKIRQASIDTGILKFKNNCFHQLAEGCSSLSGVSNNDGGNWGEVEATAGHSSVGGVFSAAEYHTANILSYVSPHA